MKYGTRYRFCNYRTYSRYYNNNNIGRASFIFIDQSHTFQKVSNMLRADQMKEMMLFNNYSISQLRSQKIQTYRFEFTKH